MAVTELTFKTRQHLVAMARAAVDPADLAASPSLARFADAYENVLANWQRMCDYFEADFSALAAAAPNKKAFAVALHHRTRSKRYASVMFALKKARQDTADHSAPGLAVADILAWTVSLKVVTTTFDDFCKGNFPEPAEAADLGAPSTSPDAGS